MTHFSRPLCINCILSLIWCLHWICYCTEGSTISQAEGSRVILHCNESNSTPHQLTWKMNGVYLISYNIESGQFRTSEAGDGLNATLSLSNSHMFALVINKAQRRHAGNYTCQVTSLTGVWEWKWELIITENTAAEDWSRVIIAAATAVPSVCFLIFLISIILQRICSRQTGHSNQRYNTTRKQEQTEDIYENCLDNNIRCPQNFRPHHHS